MIVASLLPQLVALSTPIYSLIAAALGLAFLVRALAFARDRSVAKARATATEAGGSIIETDDRDAATDAAHVIYGASWGATEDYGNVERDAGLRSDLTDWMVDELWFAKSQETCQYMQTLPLRREISVTADVLEGPRSAVVRQAANRVPIQMAILHRMILGRM